MLSFSRYIRFTDICKKVAGRLRKHARDIRITDCMSSNLSVSASSSGAVPITRSLHTPEHALLAVSIRERRIARALTQKEVALRIGRPQSFIAEVERGQRRIDIIELVALANAVGFDAAELIDSLQAMGEQDKSTGNNPE